MIESNFIKFKKFSFTEGLISKNKAIFSAVSTEQDRLPFRISDSVDADMPIRLAIARNEYFGFFATRALNSDLSSFLKS